MTETTLNFNALFKSGKSAVALKRTVTVLTGLGALAAGTLLMIDPLTGKYIKADTNTIAYQVTDDPTFSTLNNTISWVVLLAAIDTTSGDVITDVGVSGEIAEGDLVFPGSTLTAINDVARAILQMNNIFVSIKSDSKYQV